jgi:hypothetical protein
MGSGHLQPRQASPLKKWNKTQRRPESAHSVASCLNYEKGAGKVQIERAHGGYNFDMIKRCCPRLKHLTAHYTKQTVARGSESANFGRNGRQKEADSWRNNF